MKIINSSRSDNKIKPNESIKLPESPLAHNATEVKNTGNTLTGIWSFSFIKASLIALIGRIKSLFHPANAVEKQSISQIPKEQSFADVPLQINQSNTEQPGSQKNDRMFKAERTDNMTSAASPSDRKAASQGSPFEQPQALLALIKEVNTRSSTALSSKFPEELLEPFSSCPNLINELVNCSNYSNIRFYSEYGLVSSKKVYSRDGNNEAFLNRYLGLLKELQIKKYISLDVNDLSRQLPKKLKESGIEHLFSEKFLLEDLVEHDDYCKLTEKEFKEVTEKLKSSKDPDDIKEYNKMPTPEKIDVICKYLIECSEKKEPVALHCGAGDGRSGVVKVALAIKTLLAQDSAYRTENKVGQKIRCSHLGDEHKVEIFPVVSAAIDQIRATHPQVIEIRVDISILQNYAEYLLDHDKTDVSEKSS